MQALLKPGLLEKAAAAGMRSAFVGFETLSSANLREQNKYQNLNRDYDLAIKRAHDCGVMINGSFVFGMDDDDESEFSRTVDWAVGQGMETTTFHIMTPYPGTALYDRMKEQNRIVHSNWNLYDTRHVVYRPTRISPEKLEAGYWRAYRDFYTWRNIWKGARTHETMHDTLRHVAYSGGWNRFEPLWDTIIRAKRVTGMLPLLENILGSFGGRRESQISAHTTETLPTAEFSALR